MPRGMSAFGTKRKSKVCLLMTTFGGIADIATKLLTKDGVADHGANIVKLPSLLRQ